jgi:cysteine desulfurase / selenocysteine lyase
MLSISAVQYLSGFKADLEAIGGICRRNNLFFVVDGIQGLGAADINVQACNIDAWQPADTNG